MTFDPRAFMEMTTDDKMDTSVPPIPPADYPALIRKAEAFPLRDKETGTDRTDAFRLEVSYLIIDDELKTERDMPDGVPITTSIFIDLDSNGKFASGAGKNIKLGAIREALGMNGKGFNCDLLNGAGPLLIRVFNKPDKDDSTILHNNVSRVAAI